jgi:hypothetical protein
MSGMGVYETRYRIRATNVKLAGFVSWLEILSSQGERINIVFMTLLTTMSRDHDTINTIIDRVAQQVPW